MCVSPERAELSLAVLAFRDSTDQGAVSRVSPFNTQTRNGTDVELLFHLPTHLFILHRWKKHSRKAVVVVSSSEYSPANTSAYSKKRGILSARESASDELLKQVVFMPN